MSVITLGVVIGLWHQLMLSGATSSLPRKNLSLDPDLKKLETDSKTKMSLRTDLYDCSLINKGGVFGYVYNLKAKRVPVEKRMSDPESFLIMAVGGSQAIDAQNRNGGWRAIKQDTLRKMGVRLKNGAE